MAKADLHPDQTRDKMTQKNRNILGMACASIYVLPALILCLIPYAATSPDTATLMAVYVTAIVAAIVVIALFWGLTILFLVYTIQSKRHSNSQRLRYPIGLHDPHAEVDSGSLPVGHSWRSASGRRPRGHRATRRRNSIRSTSRP